MAKTSQAPQDQECKAIEDFDALGYGSANQEFKALDEVKGLIGSLPDIYKDQIAVETSCERFTFLIDEYQEQPQLLDAHLESLMNQILGLVRAPDSAPEVQTLAFKYLYLITKMRGAKVVVRQFPHEVVDVEPVLALISQQDPQNHETWETRYILLLWLAMAAMIPFDLSRLDSNVVQESGEVKQPVMDRIYNIALTYLCVQDKSRDSAAYLMSRFMTRPDVKKAKLAHFMTWTQKTLEQADMMTMAGTVKISGALATLGLLFKHGKREDLLEYAPTVLQVVHSLNLPDSNKTLIRKYGVKLLQRLGLTFLKNRVAKWRFDCIFKIWGQATSEAWATFMKYRMAKWRYQRGNRSLADNLKLSKEAVAQKQVAMATPRQTTGEEEEEEYDIPEEIEEVIEMLLTALKDKDTIVRWSGAKGIGRITGRLPKELADEVVESLMGLFTMQESDGAWHGGCLALAELGRRGLLVPQRLTDVVPVVLKALTYDEKRGNFSVGANVRDAACYVCWAFARAYEPADIMPYVQKIAGALLVVSIFDKEVNVRRAASAAFQENVGRQGTFPHGIDILTTCDFHAVGNRTMCYLELSVFVAQWSEYTQALIDHLVNIKVSHWDSTIRELTSKALHNLTEKAPEYMAKTALPQLLPQATCMDVHLRHGATLCVAEISYALSKWAKQEGRCVKEVLGQETIDGLKQIAFKLHTAKLFRGFGGELMRRAVCCLIERASLAKLPYHTDPVLDLWQEILDDCLHHLEPEIQSSAASAIPAFFSEYYVDSSGIANPQKQEDILGRYLRQLQNSLEISRIGYALALGSLPRFMLAGKLRAVLGGLIQATQISAKEEKMAEARREAVKAITSICQSVEIGVEGDPTRMLCSTNVAQVYEALLCAMKDYTLDSRGDVGAWVRESSMTGLQELTSLIVTKQLDLLTPAVCEHIFKTLIQQACEKIDRTRAVAGSAFAKLLYHSPPIPHIPHLEDIKDVFPEDKMSEINWSAPVDTFPRFIRLLTCPTYTYSVLLGVTVSAGGLTESLVKYSSQSLHSHLHTISKDVAELTTFTQVLSQIFRDYQKVDRVSLPMLKMLDNLLAKGCFDALKEGGHPFPAEILALVKAEISRSGDPQKLLASIDVMCGLLWFPAEIRQKCLSQLAIFLCHRYPLIRKTSANKLYEAILSYDDLVPEDNLEEITNILSETLWDSPVEEIRPIRNNLCSLLNIPVPAMLKKKEPGADKK